MRRLVAALGNPQNRFASIHVVGTNGKSSVTTMVAELLEASGVATGAYLSPHVDRWTERVHVRGHELSPEAFGTAVERVAQAAEPVNRTLDEGDAITEFEVVTAAAFVALAAAGVEVGVIEAGLGGRLDATNVLLSRVAVLTSVGLDHTQWLGDTTTEIAAEKLAVLREHTTLVVGPLAPDIEALAEAVAAERSAHLVRVGPPEHDLGINVPYLLRNFAVAWAAAAQLAGTISPQLAREVAAGLELPGRMEAVSGEVPMILDAAHNPDGARALAEALAARGEKGPVVGVIAILADKDAAGIIESLAPALDALVCTEVPAERLARGGRSGATTIPAAELAGIAAGVGHVEALADPRAAVGRAIQLGHERSATLLVTGSHYLLGYAAAGVEQDLAPPGR
jgi:dihydrofolate synthase / folylpolyglutamate synthase